MANYDDDQDILDDELLDDEDLDDFGYTEFDWDNLSEEETELHNAIIDMSVEEVMQLDLAPLTDLQRWAAVLTLQYAADDDEENVDDAVLDKIQSIVKPLLLGERNHPAIDYEAIAVEHCFEAALRSETALAREYLAAVHELCDGEDSTPMELEAFILFAEEDEARAMAKYQSIIDEFGDEAETLINVAGHFSILGLQDQALELVDQAETLARAENDQELIEFILEFREQLVSDEGDID